MLRYRHHIIPRHEWKTRFKNLQGFDTPDNWEWLTLEQHIQVHQLLYELNRNEFDRIAFMGLSKQIGHEESIRQSCAFANKGRHYKFTEKQKLEARIKNNKHTKLWRSKASARMKGNQQGLGYKFNKIHCQNLSKRMKNNQYTKGFRHAIVICPHCHKTGGASGMGRWHFDKCKDKQR